MRVHWIRALSCYAARCRRKSNGAPAKIATHAIANVPGSGTIADPPEPPGDKFSGEVEFRSDAALKSPADSVPKLAAELFITDWTAAVSRAIVSVSVITKAFLMNTC